MESAHEIIIKTWYLLIHFEIHVIRSNDDRAADRNDYTKGGCRQIEWRIAAEPFPVLYVIFSAWDPLQVQHESLMQFTAHRRATKVLKLRHLRV